MDRFLGATISLERQRLIKFFISACTFVAILFLLFSYYVGAYNVCYIFLITLSLCGLCLYLIPKNPQISRLLFICNYIITCFLMSISFGREAGAEIFYSFLYVLLFIFFSYTKEKKQIIFFVIVTTFVWLVLIAKEFQLYSVLQIIDVDATTIRKYIYPLSFIGNYVLVLITLIYFSKENSKFKKLENSSKEEALELLNLKTIFLNAINKDIREPLNSIIGLSRYLRDNKPRRDQKKNIKSLNLSGENLLELLNNVLNLNELEAKKSALKDVETDLQALLKNLKEVYSTKCEEKGIDLVLQIDSDFPKIQLDKVRYTQILNNLISNAIKFTHQGQVTLEIRKKEQTKNTLIFTTRVKDTGIGIAADKIDTVWDKFSQATTATTRLYGGTGLGLPIVKNIVEAMGSKISIDSTLGEGTTFSFDLNKEISHPKLKKTVTAKAIKSTDFSDKKILITDDNKINILVCKQILKKLNCTTFEAYDGFEAVIAAQNNEYDLILMDLNMPVMTGNKAIKEIRKFNKTIPIIIITASNNTNPEDFKEDNIQGFIFKPVNPEDLLTKVKSVL